MFSGTDQSKLATLIRLLLIIAGIEINPGPTPRWPCDVCQKSAARNSIECVICRKWQHLKCAEVDARRIPSGWECLQCSKKWPCGECNQSAAHSSIRCTKCLNWYHLSCVAHKDDLLNWTCKKCLPKTAEGSLRILQLNINGLRKKKNELAILLKENNVHIAMIQETKMDPETPDPHIPGYDLIRRDRNRNGGGVWCAGELNTERCGERGGGRGLSPAIALGRCTPLG